MSILCLDFDGVCHNYTSGWKGATVIPDGSVPGLVPFLERAVKQFDVQIFSSRSNQDGGMAAMQDWLRYEIADYFDVTFAGDPKDMDHADALFKAIKWPKEKPAAMVTIDDRAITFTGKWPDVKTLKEFQPWNKLKSNSSTAVASPSVSLTRIFRAVSMWIAQRVRV